MRAFCYLYLAKNSYYTAFCNCFLLSTVPLEGCWTVDPVPTLSAKGGNSLSYIACFLALAEPFNSGLDLSGTQLKAN